MRNIYYTYHVVNKNRSYVYECHTIKEIMEHTGLSVCSVEDLVKGKSIKGWSLTRTRIQEIKPEKQRTPLKPHGVIVFMPDGNTLTFKSQRKCSEELGVSASTILKYIKNGNSDSKGRFYDYPA